MQNPTVEQANLTFEDSVIEKIAGLAARNIEGILSFDGGVIGNITDRFRSKSDPTQGISADVGDKQVALDMTATVEYGHDIREMFNQICNVVSAEIEKLTGLKVIELNLHINEVMSKKEWKDSNSGKPNSALSTEETS
ncbi:Asp23/Gls24 family envelope stress response protein [Lentilactobacillus sp. SPB1-3]|uniref:Asp23/Gls24 family envelope stress response protein n=1 Tax=Lentilactobacillus terminaliae TaxID=3003483 RepID=A0ACD5DE85_9LACO|nr:Asp23/Gls24 family envelope stress response protein [Lentilactobacillus sp. SPB1-3]MCZ0977470.1 Asp23/Gls24 family envelope stress response protein [Lentilactobacillus sp. SPB1-3]